MIIIRANAMCVPAIHLAECASIFNLRGVSGPKYGIYLTREQGDFDLEADEVIGIFTEIDDASPIYGPLLMSYGMGDGSLLTG